MRDPLEDLRTATKEILEKTDLSWPTDEVVELRYMAYYIGAFLLRLERQDKDRIMLDKPQIRMALERALEKLEEY